MDEFARVNTAPIDGTCLNIRHLCAEYDKLNNLNIHLNLNNAERIKKHQEVVHAIKRNIRYLNELIK